MENNRFRALVEHFADPIWMLAESGEILYASPASQRMLGYSPEDLAGANAFDFFMPSDRAEARARLYATAEPAAFRMRRKDGAMIWAEAAGSNRLAEPDIRAVIVSLRDVTGSRRSEQLLRDSESRFRALIENSSDGFALLDREGRVTYSGPSVLGYGQGAIVGRSILELIHPDDLAAACGLLAGISAHPGKCVTAEYRVRHADGSWHWIEGTFKNMLADRIVGGMIVNYRDVTLRRRHEEEIQQGRDEVRSILESIQESFIALDRDWRFKFVNRRVAAVTGKAPDELIGQNLWELFPEARETDFYPQYQRVMTERVATHFEMHYPPSGRWFDVHAYPTDDGLSAYILDVTDRKRAERHGAVHHAVTQILSESTTLAEIAPRIMRAIGEGLGWPVATFWTLDARQEVLRCADSWRAAKTPRGRFVQRSREFEFHKGEDLPGLTWSEARPQWIANIDEFEGRRRAKQAAAEGLRSAFSLPLMRGGEVVAVMEFLSPQVRERDAEVLQLLDILTGQIAQFLHRKWLEEHLHHVQKLEGIGILAGGLAHDFNDRLSAIANNIDLALEALPPTHPSRRYLDEVARAGEAAAGLVRQLSSYAGKGRFRTEPVDLSRLARSTTEVVRRSIPTSVDVRLDLAPDLPAVEADFAQLQQALMNLLINAAEAIGEGQAGTIHISTGVQQVDDALIRKSYAAGRIEPGDYVCLEVRDNGCGMDDETLSRVFEPFFTTKAAGRGLGLAAVLGIVAGHRGAVKIDSAPGHGAAIRILLPAMTEKSGSGSVASSAAARE